MKQALLALGLRLQPETLLLPVLVIDHVEQPTAD
jgi:uncharacterized protein (TIGR03435 family)